MGYEGGNAVSGKGFSTRAPFGRCLKPWDRNLDQSVIEVARQGIHKLVDAKHGVASTTGTGSHLGAQSKLDESQAVWHGITPSRRLVHGLCMRRESSHCCIQEK